jgi:predicted ferric reductase
VSGNVTWYVDRGAGIVALVLLTIAAVLGIVSAIRVRSPQWPRFAIADLHRNVALLALVFGVVHVFTSVVDHYVNIRLMDAFVPFVSSYKPFWVGVGAIGADLMLAVLVTSALRRRIGYRRWRTVRGKPSSRKPSPASSTSVITTLQMSSSGTSAPSSM